MADFSAATWNNVALTATPPDIVLRKISSRFDPSALK
jgi:hypothetical protein